MTLTFIDLIPIFLVFILYFMGLPIVYSLFGATFFYFMVLDPSTKCWLILQKVMNSTQSFSMLAIPFFIMAGSVMNFGGISEKMMDFCECVTGHMRGRLGTGQRPSFHAYGRLFRFRQCRLRHAVQNAGARNGAQRLFKSFLRRHYGGLLSGDAGSFLQELT